MTGALIGRLDRLSGDASDLIEESWTALRTSFAGASGYPSSPFALGRRRVARQCCAPRLIRTSSARTSMASIRQRTGRAVAANGLSTSYALRFSVPLAFDQILARPPVGSAIHASPYREAHSISAYSRSVSAAAWLAQSTARRAASPRSPSYQVQAALMFALASWLAFQHDLWCEAVPFTDFAAQPPRMI